MGTSIEQNTLNIRQEEKNKRDHRTEKGPMGTSTEQKNGSSNIRKDHKKPQRRKIPNVKQSGTLGTSEHHKAMIINPMPTKEVPNVTKTGTLGTNRHRKALTINPMPTKEVPNVTQSRTLGTNRHHKAMTIKPMQAKEVPNVT